MRSRRTILRKLGSATTLAALSALAGCSESVTVEIGDSDDATRTLRPTESPTPTPTSTATPTPTDVDTMTETATTTADQTATETSTPATGSELVARYPFDGHVRDVAGGNDLSGDEPTYVDGPVGSAAAGWEGRFAASSELYAPTTDDALTFAFWMRDDGTRSTWDDDLLWKLNSANDEQVGVYCATDGEVFIFTAGQGDNNTKGMSGTSVLDGQWHHVAFVYDQPLDRMALYVDGAREFDVEYTDEIPGMEDTRLFFGNDAPNGSKGYDGALDDFRYYSDALRESEVRALYELGDSETSTVTATETESPTPTATATETETPTPTATATETPTPTATETATSTASDLVARYRFEGGIQDATGQYDLSGPEPSYVAGPEGETASAWSGNFVSTGSGFYAPEPGEALSVCFWLRDNGTDSRWDDDLLWKITSEGGDAFGSFCDTDGDVFVFTSGNNTVGESTTSLLDGQWHHVAFVYEQGDDRMQLYLDGEADYAIDYGDDLTGMETTALMFGNNGDSGWKTYDGGLDDWRLYRRALSGDEIAAIADQ